MLYPEYVQLVFDLRQLLSDILHIGVPEWEGKTGGYFCLADAGTGNPLFEPALIGTVPQEKKEKYLAFCQEKAKRLANHPEHEASWESRNEEANEWGGALRIGTLIFSFSGLPEWGDEALMLILAEVHFSTFGDIDIMLEAAHRIVSKTRNPYWQELRGKLFGRIG